MQKHREIGLGDSAILYLFEPVRWVLTSLSLCRVLTLRVGRGVYQFSYEKDPMSFDFNWCQLSRAGMFDECVSYFSHRQRKGSANTRSKRSCR